MSISEHYIIEKRNILNEIRASNMSLQELRFFSIYLAKINPRDESTRIVCFPLEDFRNIMELGRLNINSIKTSVNSLLSKVINIPLEKKGNYIAFQLFKECKVAQDKNDNWYVEIDAHDKALPLMFDFKEKYFSYNLWNALGLKSSNQLRMYEILKQYERIGERTISLNDLKELLGIDKEEYPIWERFKTRILESCKKSLIENTDIYYDYEIIRKKTGKGGKVEKIKFKIYKNVKFKDPLSLSEFIEKNALQLPVNISTDNDCDDFKQTIKFLSTACKDEFNDSQIKLLCEYIFSIVQKPVNHQILEIERYHYLARKYAELEWRATQTIINNRFLYLEKIIKSDLDY